MNPEREATGALKPSGSSDGKEDLRLDRRCFLKDSAAGGMQGFINIRRPVLVKVSRTKMKLRSIDA